MADAGQNPGHKDGEDRPRLGATTSRLRFAGSLLAGCVIAIAIAYAGFTLLRALWPEYAAAEPHKHYTLAMLFSRLALGAFCTSGAACVTTILARDKGRAAWWLGTLFTVVSLPSHLYYSRNDYPIWYHLLYLSYLIPIAALTARVLRGSVEPARQTTTVTPAGRSPG